MEQCTVDWKMSFGVTFWNIVDLAIILACAFSVYMFVWKPLLDYFDLNKESIRR